MSTTPTPAPATPSTSAAAATLTETQKIGRIVELAGIAAFSAGVILSAHHYAIGILCVSGALAYVIGKKLRGSAAHSAKSSSNGTASS